MALILPFLDHMPRIADGVFLADNATVIGDVDIGEGSNVWFGAVLRGDVGPIRIGKRSNIQDGTIVHTTTNVSEAHIGDDVTVGHGCILHGCRIGHRVLVGMGSILLDNAMIGDDVVIGAGSLVTARMVIPAGALVMGRPAKVIRQATEAERRLGPDGAATYAALGQAYASARTR
jgi:carbonic anhydrase/acetyltransferase-like protein (isoleucine patch superfamily)